MQRKKKIMYVPQATLASDVGVLDDSTELSGEVSKGFVLSCDRGHIPSKTCPGRAASIQ
jgi:hypothetical protein